MCVTEEWVEKLKGGWDGCSCSFWATIDCNVLRLRGRSIRVSGTTEESTDETVYEMSIVVK
jgi:hypothetical protein